MFFQDASAAGSGATPPKDNFDFDNVRKGLDGISREIIGTFTQGRERVFEFERAVADSLPAVRSLGGDIKDVGKIIQEVGLAARRNVVANEDEIKSLFSASEVLGLTTQQIADSFLDVGVGIESISDALEGSIDYVRGIGGNARQVMKDVQANMEQMNRYQFEGGVVGLTKMAAQASMLRFDMQQTFQLAEKVLSPEGAVETAAAFQRLGLAVGNLADPFALMNASINDPGSLQDSLVEVSKQFTYFDEKTKTFKINPQGVLTLRELESQTGVSAKEMSKLGLAAAELDQRLTQISPTLKFQNEEDKQYLANIGRMGEGGQYEVKIKGQEDYVKLGQLTQEQLDELITEQKTGPKTVEELQRAQLTVDELIQSDIAAIKYAVLGGILTDKNIQDLREGGRTLAEVTGRAGVENISMEKIRELSEQSSGNFRKTIEDMIKGGDIKGALTTLVTNSTESFGTLTEKSKEMLSGAADQIKKELSQKGGFVGDMSGKVDLLLDNLSGKIQGLDINMFKGGGKGGTTTEDDYWTNLTVEGSSGANRNLGTVADQVREQKSLIELLGEIKVNVNFQDLPAGLTTEQKEQITKTFSDKINAQNFKDYIVNVTRPDNAFRGGGTATY
jgi:hypothetical protein